MAVVRMIMSVDEDKVGTVIIRVADLVRIEGYEIPEDTPHYKNRPYKTRTPKLPRGKPMKFTARGAMREKLVKLTAKGDKTREEVKAELGLTTKQLSNLRHGLKVAGVEIKFSKSNAPKSKNNGIGGRGAITEAVKEYFRTSPGGGSTKGLRDLMQKYGRSRSDASSIVQRLITQNYIKRVGKGNYLWTGNQAVQ